MLKTTGIRLAELAGLRYDSSDSRCSDIDLCQWEITVRSKGGKDRIDLTARTGIEDLDLHPEGEGRLPAPPAMWARSPQHWPD